jgi:hypothetical protein
MCTSWSTPRILCDGHVVEARASSVGREVERPRLSRMATMSAAAPIIQAQTQKTRLTLCAIAWVRTVE